VELGLGLLLALLVALAVVGIVAAHALYSSAQTRYVKEAFPLRASSQDLTLQMVNEETAMRGYLITASEASLAPYSQGRRVAAQDLAALQAGARRRPSLGSDIARVSQLRASLDRYFEREIALVRTGAAGQKRAQERVLAGKEQFDRFRAASGELEATIDRLVAAAKAHQHRTYVRTLFALLAAGAAGTAIAVLVLLTVPRRLQRLYRAEQAGRERAERGDRASRALAHVDEAVILLDLDGRIAYWNTGAETLIGISEPDALGRVVSDVLPAFAAVEAAARGTDVVVPLTVGGHERWVEAYEATFTDGRVFVLRDVTQAQVLERTRIDFVSTAAHELRTPVAAVYGAVRTLRRRDVELPTDTQLEFMEMIETESERLAVIVDQILTTASLDRGDLYLRARPVDVRGLAEDAIRTAELLSPSSISFSFLAPEQLEPLLCDEGRLRQVLANLVDNAVKYSPEGGAVELSIVDTGEAVRIAVRDEGLGIPEPERERIFEKFYRLDPELSRGIGGSGLGLYISRALATQMGGLITVAGAPERGSIFTLELIRRS
jgi:PAS domain S-box-containing protein